MRTAQAEKLAAKGTTVLDVRPAYQYERERVAGAVNVPMFRKVAGTGPWDNAKKLVMRFGLAMEATGAVLQHFPVAACRPHGTCDGR